MGINKSKTRLITALRIFANVWSFIALYVDPHIYLEPIPTICIIRKEKSVSGFKPDPYLAAVISCLFWIFCGFVHPDRTLVITMNCIGLAMEFFYLAHFYVYGDNKMRIKMSIVLLAEVILIGIIATVTFTAFHTHEKRSTFVGAFCVAFGIVMLFYVSPLTVLYNKVWKEKDEECMYIMLSLVGCINGLAGVLYAILWFDLIFIIFNGMSAIWFAIQLLLWTCATVILPRGCAAAEQTITQPIKIEMAEQSRTQ